MNMHTTIVAAVPQVSQSDWYEMLATRDSSARDLKHYNDTVLLPLEDELERTSPRPDLCFVIEAMSGQVARYPVPANDLHRWDNHWSPLVRRKAKEVREAWLAYRAVCDRLGWDAACAESERLCSIQCGFEHELVIKPAPDLAALLWKLEHLFGAEAREDHEFCDSWCPEFVNALMVDARRLLTAIDAPLLSWAAQAGLQQPQANVG